MPMRETKESGILLGIAVLVLLVLAGAAVFILARFFGAGHHAKAARQGPPPQGAIPSERHVGTVASGL